MGGGPTMSDLGGAVLDSCFVQIRTHQQHSALYQFFRGGLLETKLIPAHCGQPDTGVHVSKEKLFFTTIKIRQCRISIEGV